MSNYDLIYNIGEIIDGVYFEKIEGYSLVGSPLSNAHKHPIQYHAYTNVRSGDDDPFEGVGWTPNEALRNLYKELLKVREE